MYNRLPYNQLMSSVLWLLGGIAVLAAFVLVWNTISESGSVSPVFFPPPAKVWRALIDGFATSTLSAQTVETLQRMAIGWLLASVGAITIGCVISVSPLLNQFLTPSLEFLRPLPASATIPLFIAAFGLSNEMVLAAVSFGAVWPPLLSTISGFRSIEPRLYDVSATLGLSRVAFITKVALPSAFPEILSGMRLSLTISLVLTIVCEMLAGVGGLGEWILNAGRLFRADNLYAGVILLGAIGLVCDTSLSFIEARLLRWRTA